MKPAGAQRVAAFNRAVWTHDDRTVAALIAKVDPNGADRWGHRPLSMAVQYGDAAMVECLLKRGALVDEGRRHLTPLALAARRCAGDMVQLLRAAGAVPSIVAWTYLGDRPRVEAELSRDPALARLRDEAATPLLLHAVEALRPDLVALLLDRGATLADTDEGGETALHRIADLRRAPQTPAAAVATLLLDRGADPNARNWAQVTPLHQAVRARNLAVVELLLARGAQVDARDNRGSTPLRRAVSGTGASHTAGTTDLMAPLTRLLLKHGADPDATDKRGIPVRASARAPEVLAVLEEFRPRQPRPPKPKKRRR